MVASRLTENPDVSVLLVEAGESGERDPAVATPGRWVSLLGSPYDWGYTTEAEPGLEGRRLACPRGKALGGSSAINAMVHIRGHRDCFDTWRALGNRGWGYEDLLPLFLRSESREGQPGPHGGAAGRLAVRECLDPHASHHAFLRAAADAGFVADPNHDFNRPDPDGVAGFVAKNILNGRRHSTSTAFLEPVGLRRNLTVVNGHVTRIVLEGRRAVGVEYLEGGRLERVRAAREVILSAGAIASPRVLLSSGIGAADDLRGQGIAPVVDLPGVGRNLQDHLKLSVRWAGKTVLPGSTVTAGLFVPSGLRKGRADLQFYVGRGLSQPDELVTITVSLVRVASRGRVTLGSPDPLAPPLIQVNYLREGEDVEALARGVGLARRLGRSRAYDGLRGSEAEPGDEVTSAVDVERFVRHRSDTIFHVAGTCRMGPASDGAAVVDETLRVHGVEGLRVADASIMPEIVNAPTHAACVAIGEKCADLLR